MDLLFFLNLFLYVYFEIIKVYLLYNLIIMKYINLYFNYNYNIYFYFVTFILFPFFLRFIYLLTV